ncbi:hypothetical protein [Metaclostridioides mangenotii]|uniref:hypothetical protein n=1 Tax=Metaclostridioides mangenotii TaxID=1540 RepID=UPI000485A255|nr:hypothetical protein [Clostridioides mangenotii]
MLNESFRSRQIYKLKEVKDNTDVLEHILKKQDIDFKDIVEFISLEGKIVTALQNIANDILDVSI